MKSRFVFLVLLLAVGRVWARGGGGCFEAGTPVLTPSGPVAIEQLRVGDAVIGGRVAAVHQVMPAEYLELPDGTHVTAEHPFQLQPGIFQTAERRFPNASRIPATRPAYNLLVAPGGTYIARGYRVHNKGCFLPDTPVLAANGSRVAISAVRPGDRLLAFELTGNVVTTTVNRVLTHDVQEFLIVNTDAVELRVTIEHPFYVGDGMFKTLEALRPGDAVYAYSDAGWQAQRIVSLTRIRQATRVYNLQTDAPNTYFANGIAVHNKGGGCFAAGTPVRTPTGDRAIETLQPGDRVLTGQGGVTTVEATFVTRDRVLTLVTAAGELRTTAEHPVLCADGSFRPAGELAAGDRLPAGTLLRCVSGEEQVVYNLRVGEPHTFVAAGFVVHNKGGGCFPAGTRIRTPHGTTPIEALRAGDAVVSGDGQRATVVTTHVTRDRVLALVTDRGILRTTAEHPVLCEDGQFRAAGQLVAGSGLSGATILRCETGPEQTVYNLTVTAPHTFIADGFVVHNKGGGGFHGGRSGGSGRPMTAAEQRVFLMILGGVAVFFIVAYVAGKRRNEDEDLDFCYPRTTIEAKVSKTRKLLEFIARVDDAFGEEKLRQQATATFLKLQECWQAREYTPMQALLMPDLFRTHSAQLEGMRRHHEINILQGLHVNEVDIVNVRYPRKAEQREFTALISARARDYYVDDRTRSVLRGDEAAAAFQEFWTFQWQGGRWLLREIEQTRESDVLTQENFFEPFTDKGVEQVYGDSAQQQGAAGPWLDKAVEVKATRIERLLNFLAQTDKLWDRQAMLERCREVFLGVMLAREEGNPTSVRDSDLFPAVATDLRQEIARLHKAGTTVEYRNLCVRKVELIHVRNEADNTQDEFTVRIDAHAQRCVQAAGAVLRQDEYVTPFASFWTFGRLDGKWKLKEVLPEEKGERLLSQENVDEGADKAKLEWYYRQTRA